MVIDTGLTLSLALGHHVLPGFIAPAARRLAELLADLIAAAQRRAALAKLVPAVDVREVSLQVHALALVGNDPGPAGDVGDGVLVADVFPPLQAPVEHAIEAQHLAVIAFLRILDLLRRIELEVAGLADHRTEAAHLPHQPLVHFRAFAQVFGIEQAGFGAEIDQDGASFEYADRAAAAKWVVIDDGGDAV